MGPAGPVSRALDKGTMEQKLAAQARIYGDILEACLSAGNFKAFGMWGFTDRHSWILWFTGQADAPLIFDESYRPKPAYTAMADVLTDPARQRPPADVE